MEVQTLQYMRAVYAAHAALRLGDIAKVKRAAARLRAVAPDHGLVPILEAKVQQLSILIRIHCQEN